MTRANRLSCVLCHNYVTHNTISSCKFFCTKFFNCLLQSVTPDTSDGLCEVGRDLRGNLRFLFCASCQKLLMKFQLLNQRLEKLRTRNMTQAKALMPSRIGTQFETGTKLRDKSRSFDHKCTDGNGLNSTVVQAHDNESATEYTAEIQVLEKYSVSEISEIEDSNTAEESLGEESTNLTTEQLDKLAFSTTSSSLVSNSASRVLSNASLPPTSSSNSSVAGRKQTVARGTDDANPEGAPVAGVQNTFDQGTPRMVYGEITELSQNKFLYLEKYPFDGTSYGFRCGSCEYYTTFSKSQDRFANILRHIRGRHEETGGRQFREKRRIVEVSPNHFMCGTLEFEKINEEFVCRSCGRSYPDRKKINKHMEYHRAREEKTERICEICGEVFKTLDSFKHHKSSRHKEQNAPAVACKECGKAFKFRSELKLHHDRVHLKKLDFICSYCGRQFFTKTQLRDHEHVHTGEKTYKCPTCGKQFAKSTSLWRHQFHHTGRKFTCNICDMEFSQPDSVARHKKTAHMGWKNQSSGKNILSKPNE